MPSDESFRQRVINLATEIYPDIAIETHPDALDVVIAEGNQVSLQNLWASYKLSESSEAALRALVRHHFRQLRSRQIPAIGDLQLSEAKAKLYPQIMPAEYVDSAPLPILSFPLSSELNVGLVADFPETYMYLRELELERWCVSVEELYQIAIRNLEELSQSVRLEMAGEGNEAFFAVATGDGYDAARILAPRFQRFLAQHLGESFRFALPNRDFLICWRLDCEPSFHRQLALQVGADNSERPYPLSASVFVRNSEGNIHEQRPA